MSANWCLIVVGFCVFGVALIGAYLGSKEDGVVAYIVVAIGFVFFSSYGFGFVCTKLIQQVKHFVG